MTIKNWLGQEHHAIDDYCWFQTTPEKREEMRELFDSLIGDVYPENRMQRKHLIELLDRVREIATHEAEFFSQGD